MRELYLVRILLISIVPLSAGAATLPFSFDGEFADGTVFSGHLDYNTNTETVLTFEGIGFYRGWAIPVPPSIGYIGSLDYWEQWNGSDSVSITGDRVNLGIGLYYSQGPSVVTSSALVMDLRFDLSGRNGQIDYVEEFIRNDEVNEDHSLTDYLGPGPGDYPCQPDGDNCVYYPGNGLAVLTFDAPEPHTVILTMTALIGIGFLIGFRRAAPAPWNEKRVLSILDFAHSEASRLLIARRLALSRR